MFSDGTAAASKKFKEEEKQMTKLIKEQIGADGANVAELIKENSDFFNKNKEENKRLLQLLAPKRQILRIFPILFLAIAAMMVFTLVIDHRNYLLQKEESVKYCDLVLWGLFLISITCSFLGILFLKQVAWAVIDVREQMAKDKEREKRRSSPFTIKRIE